MTPRRDALPIRALPDDIQAMRELAFDPSTVRGGRPTAEIWMTTLQTLGRSVRRFRQI